MQEERLSEFELDARLARDTELVASLGLCQLRMMKDSRWPWFMLVPQRNGVSEVFELTPLDQAILTFETNTVAAALKKATGAEKTNVAAIGNIVRQLHVHIVARSEGDPNWPGPIWGFGQAESYDDAARQILIDRLTENLAS
ncbi:HIT family protein [Aliirhizobium smilacinae]|uniref:HIT family protein n=1 Tax=Aliirhizobium smilacinae TaxID=1395944 RepID=A0A5C4XTT3_9HYPH|nr:HIT family protein [Rhizobium smilacinae]TNM66561.1 HIT family protein [Rhizobium smilacinae]